MSKDIPVLNTKWLEIYFGLFGPAITYHTTGYDDDNARLVISLIIFKLYITLPWKGKQADPFEMYAEYGFYCTNEPVHQFVWRWGTYYKTIPMPWAMVTKSISLLDNTPEYNVIKTYSYKDSLGDLHSNVAANLDKCLCTYDNHFNYYVERIVLVPLICKWLNVEWFKKIRYSVTLMKGSFCYMSFTTDIGICFPEQIDVQLAALQNIKEF